MAGDLEFDISAALLRHGRDIPHIVASLADRLEQALPDHVDVERAAFRRHVRQVTVRLDPTWFRIELHGHRAVAWVDHVVRGVQIRSDDVDVDTWLDQLAAALSKEAARSTAVRLALENALLP